MVKPKPIKPVAVPTVPDTVDKKGLKVDKRGKKRKAENAPNEDTDKTPVDAMEKKRSNDAGIAPIEVGKDKKPIDEKEKNNNGDSGDEVVKLNHETIKSCVNAFIKLLELKEDDKNELISEGVKLHMTVDGIRIL